MVLRVSEVYKSVQGEGPRVGWPTIFVRFGGCNLRCPGWPCDTQHAIDPKYRTEWKKYEVDALAEVIADTSTGLPDTNICFTGGEPMLQQEGDLYLLVQALWQQHGFQTIEMFSNGTLAYPAWVHEHIHLIMDWKLAGAGENFTARTEENRWNNIANLDDGDAVKFVIKDSADYEEAMSVWFDYQKMTRRKSFEQPEFFYGIVWGGEFTNEQLVEKVLADGLPWRLNIQTHNHIWDRNKRGI